MKHICLFLLLILNTTTRAQVYKHDFGTIPISAHPYNVAPAILQSNISASSWTNSTSSWTNYAGNTGEALAISNSGGSPTITLTFNVAAGYHISISGFDFWRQRSATGAQNWSMTINGISVGSGTIPTTGAATGVMMVTNPVVNLTGNISVLIVLSGASGTGTFRVDDFTLYGMVLPNAYTMLDHFNRNDTIRPGIPSSGGSAWWVEQEPGFCFSGGSALEKIRIKNNQLELSSCTYTNNTCLSSPTQATGMNMTGKYPTIFSTAAGTMEWYFNMQQNRTDPNGFEAGQYGVAFVIGSNTNDPLASSKYGYAVIFGEAGTTDPLRLVTFNGSVFNTTTFTNILEVPSPAVKTNHMSIKVTFNPCNSEWSLTVRDDGLSFADPSTVSGIGATAINSTFTSSDLLWLGQVWNHGNTCSLAKFDNIYMPKVGVNTGTYTWNGSVNTDFQLSQNWSPVRQCAKPADKLVFNSASPISSVLTNIPDQTIGQLTVTNNRTLNLQDIPGNGNVSTLTIIGAAGTDLQIDAGSSLIFDVSSAAVGDGMVIDLASGTTALISGVISFYSQTGGTKSHRLLATDAMAITVSNTGVIKAMNLLGNPFGTSLPQNTVVFNAGAAYECYSGANPFGLSQPSSKVIFNTGSVYRHYATTQPSVLGRTYADVEFYESTNISTGGASAFTLNNLKILNGSVQFTGSANTQPVNTNVRGDFIQLPGTTFNYDPVVASAFVFNGAAAQKINSTGILTLGKLLTVRLSSSFTTAPQLTVETDIKIAGTLDIVLGTLMLTGNIHLLSDAASTASVAPITGAISYAAGRFVVERYIPNHSKAWQFLAVPTTGQTVNATWQEGNAPLANGIPGYGTIISNNIPGPGFDIIAGAGPSMKSYDTSGNGSWKGIGRTDTAIYNKKGYMIFVRGDRSVTSSGSAPTATTLRTTGKIFDPISNVPPVTNIATGKFESIGNPYASAIDFSNDLAVIKSANIQKVFYVWDPKLGGNNNLGGYQTCIKGTGSDYTILPGGGSYDSAGTVQNLVQSGQAFFVRTFGGTGNISFTENAKVKGSRLFTRPGIPNVIKQLRTSLYAISGEQETILDAVLSEFNAAFSNHIDILDVLKLHNTNETIGISSSDQLLAVERRGDILPADYISFNLNRLKIQQYAFKFNPVNLLKQGREAFLEDRYLQTKTPVSLSAITKISFYVLIDPGSYATDRFRLVFKQQAIHPHIHDCRINKIKTDEKVLVYPNPVTDRSFTVCIKDQPAGIYQVHLYNQSGQFVLEQAITVSGNYFSAEIKVPMLPAGNYQLQVISAAGFKTAQQVNIQ